jgi:hypothetical protein
MNVFDSVFSIAQAPVGLEKLKGEGQENRSVTRHTASDSVDIKPFIYEFEKRRISVTRIGAISS